jgi:hypothetical protein
VSKQDIRIGQRTYEELCRLFPDKSTTQVAKILGCRRQAVYWWRDGITPSAIFLQRLAFLGADIDWILTGRRKDK